MVEKICGVCQKKGAQFTCHECGIPLCDECVREVQIESTAPGQRMMGKLTSPLKPAVRKLKVCQKCMREAEFIG